MSTVPNNAEQPAGMRSILPEWYAHDAEVVKMIVTTGTVALDANVLLDLYRVRREQREEILGVLERVRDRIFIPYQVAYEYQKNRLNTAAGSERLLRSLPPSLKIKEETLNGIQDTELRSEIAKLNQRAVKKFTKKLERLIDDHLLRFADVYRDDPVRAALDDLLDDQALGKKPKDDDLKEAKKIALQRIKDQIPPGYCDAKDKDDATGDYLMWSELLTYAHGSERPMLLVTNDQKEDWYLAKTNGHSRGPRPELIAEMRERLPDHPYHQVTLGSFLRFANEHLGATVTEETIETVKDIPRQSSNHSDIINSFIPASMQTATLSNEARQIVENAINAQLRAANLRAGALAGFDPSQVNNSEFERFMASGSIQETTRKILLEDEARRYREFLESIVGNTASARSLETKMSKSAQEKASHKDNLTKRNK